MDYLFDKNRRTSSIKFSVFLWKGHNKRLRGQTINKTVTNENHTELNRTKTVIWNGAVFSVCVSIVKTWHFNVCPCVVVPKNQISRQGRDIGSCESLVNYYSQNLMTILVQFLQICISTFHLIEITWRKMARWVCLKLVSMERDVYLVFIYFTILENVWAG